MEELKPIRLLRGTFDKALAMASSQATLLTMGLGSLETLKDCLYVIKQYVDQQDERLAEPPTDNKGE